MIITYRIKTHLWIRSNSDVFCFAHDCCVMTAKTLEETSSMTKIQFPMAPAFNNDNSFERKFDTTPTIQFSFSASPVTGNELAPYDVCCFARYKSTERIRFMIYFCCCVKYDGIQFQSSSDFDWSLSECTPWMVKKIKNIQHPFFG